MLNFTFFNPTKIYFGKGQISNLRTELKGRYKKALIVTGGGSVKRNGVFDDVIRQLKDAAVSYCELEGVKPNPRLKSVHEGIEIARQEQVDFILPVGGGSVIDAGKAIAAGVPYKGDVWDFYEGASSPLSALPVGAVLTLAATGTEMNHNSVITKEDSKRKLPLRTPVIQPKFSILDPVYTITVNKFHTAAGVADIMAHIFEGYLPPATRAYTQDSLAEGLLRTCTRFGPAVLKRPEDYEARANILWASTLALNGLLGSGKEADWTIHMAEHEVSAIYDISHGAGLAVLIPNFMKIAADKYGPYRIAEYGRNVWGIRADVSDREIADEAICKTREFFDFLDLPSTLGEMNIFSENIDMMAERAVDVRAKIGKLDQMTVREVRKMLELSL